MILVVCDEVCRRVRQLKDFGSELQFKSILQGEFLEDRKIEMREVRIKQAVSTEVLQI